MEWKTDILQYTSGERLFLGPWEVGGCHYDSTRSRDDPAKWAATCKLPGIKTLLGHFEDDATAKATAERAVAHWLGKLPSNVELRGAEQASLAERPSPTPGSTAQPPSLGD